MEYNIRQDVIESLDRYVNHGIKPGGFLEAVLANDLMESFGRADMGNRLSLFDILSYVYNELPANCHGSYEMVNSWMERFKKKAVS